MFKIAIVSALFCQLFVIITSLRCPKYWTDATRVDLGCLLFDVSSAKSWVDFFITFCFLERTCKFTAPFETMHDAHGAVVIIFVDVC